MLVFVALPNPSSPKAVALIIIAVASVLVVFDRFRKNMPVAIVGYAMLAVGLALGLLSR